jgi:uncharacterized protein (TIGR04222 family)
MRPEHAELWERIETFDIDGEPTPSLCFAKRLARENSWSKGFAERAIREYRRYVFLAMTVGRSMCPSEQVDQVWHLHLTYTRSYWKRFCGEVLKCPLHHEPTRGGSDEGRKHWAMYADTLLAYREAFGEDPQNDLWPPAGKRFGEDVAVHRYDANAFWLVPKPHKGWLAAAALLVSTVFVVGCAGPGNPFDLNGTEFLPVLFIAYAVAFFLAYIVRRKYRGPDLNPGESEPELDPYEVAYLTGGRPRVVGAVLVSLKEQGYLEVSESGQVTVRSFPMDGDKLEEAVMAELAGQNGKTLDLKPLRVAVQQIEERRFRRLEKAQLITDQVRRKLGTLVPFGFCLATLFLFGFVRLMLGMQNDKPSGYLIASLVILFIVTAVVFGRAVRRTYKGDAVLANLSKRHTGLRKLRGDLDTGDAALAVGLFGIGVLSGTVYAAMYDRMHKFDSAGSGGGCGSGCGGGGGDGGCGGGGGDGGGGCGGCGGGGD